MRFVRWAAVILWVAAAAYAVSIVMTDEFATVAGWGTTAICLAFAAFLALGGSLGVIAAIAATGVAALGTIAGLGLGRWELAAAAGVLPVASALSIGEFRRALAPA